MPDDVALYLKHPQESRGLDGLRPRRCGEHSGIWPPIAGADKLYAIIGGLHFMGLPEARVKEAAE